MQELLDAIDFLMKIPHFFVQLMTLLVEQPACSTKTVVTEPARIHWLEQATLPPTGSTSIQGAFKNNGIRQTISVR
jgi:hypothetical protein